MICVVDGCMMVNVRRICCLCCKVVCDFVIRVWCDASFVVVCLRKKW